MEELTDYIKEILKDPKEFDDFLYYVERTKPLTEEEMMRAMFFGISEKTKEKTENALIEWRKEKLIVEMAGIK